MKSIQSNAPFRQRGVALVVSLLLLIIVAIVGLAAVRGTLMQQKMASNAYDREQAFQAAEAALRVATAVLPTIGAGYARNCQAAGQVCPTNPFIDTTLPTGAVKTVTQGTGAATAFTASSVAAAQPQYVIEFMGSYQDPNGIGNNSANMQNAGVQGSGATAMFYRITARSGDPKNVGDRAVVTIQATVKQG
jgi:type IV pilus assembly protein PilX